MSGPDLSLRRRDPAETATLAARLAATGRVQIPDLLEVSSAERLLTAARLDTDFQTVTLGGKGHVDLPAAWLEAMTPAQRTDFGRASQEAATERFHYLYDNHPIWDLNEAGRLNGVWKDWLDFVNGAAFLDAMREVTGEDRIAFADAQVTRYRRGHFLTAHDDGNEGKNRYYAFVMNLSPRWKIEWGGLLMFHGDDGHVSEALLPKYNSLSLLKVPALHSVSQVSLFAGDDRLAVTGWLRGR